jgi:hypothetical protein
MSWHVSQTGNSLESLTHGIQSAFSWLCSLREDYFNFSNFRYLIYDIDKVKPTLEGQ